MFKPDVIVAWPRNCDYPIWRQFIKENRTRFNLVIIVFTETNFGDDYREFVKNAMLRDYVLFINNPPIQGREDWRDLAIHQALIHSYNAEWIWFTEQDFFIKDGFWEEAESFVKNNFQVMGTYDFMRLHPCNIFIKREILMTKTRRNFGIVPDISDHFSMIQRDLKQNEIDVGTFPLHTYEHLNGLSHNLKLIWEGSEVAWQKERFIKYLLDSLKVDVDLDPRYIALAERYLKTNYSDVKTL